jgi:hypothetical protein
MLIYEPTIYPNLDYNLYDTVYDYLTGEVVGQISESNQQAIVVGGLCYWCSGLSKEAPCLIKSANFMFNITDICDMTFSILWYYSLKYNHRIKC